MTYSAEIIKDISLKICLSIFNGRARFLILVFLHLSLSLYRDTRQHTSAYNYASNINALYILLKLNEWELIYLNGS